ncbi:MAG: SRPBCC family protein [Pseudomonadota bacterium]
MAQVTRSVVLGADPDTVWSAIGGFQALGDWHPAIVSSTREDIGAAEHRRLAVADGEEIVEKHMGADTHSYGYAIIDGPLPVAHYRAVLSVVPAPGGSVAVWTATFTPKSKDAETVIGGIFDAGLGVLKERFGG